MKAALGSMGTALVASACCIGPVVFSLMGAGALSAASTKLEPYRPWFMAGTAALLGVAFYAAYRPAAGDTAATTCVHRHPSERRRSSFGSRRSSAPS